MHVLAVVAVLRKRRNSKLFTVADIPIQASNKDK